MMILQIKLFIFHISRDTQLGTTYRATLETMQLEVGSLTSVLSLPYKDYHFLATNTWLKNLWFCVDKYGIELRTPSPLVQLQRQNDFSLMDSLISSQVYTRQDIIRINLCRLFVQCFFMSDITAGNGKNI